MEDLASELTGSPEAASGSRLISEGVSMFGRGVRIYSHNIAVDDFYKGNVAVLGEKVEDLGLE